MAQVQMGIPSGVNIGPVIQGGAQTYIVDARGVVTVNATDVPAMLRAGLTYVKKVSQFYTTPAAVAAASAAVLVASAALSNGSLAIAAQPGVMRQAALIIGAGTTALSAGAVTVTYIGNDGQTITEALSAICAASATTTQFLSRGVAHINTVVVSAINGGASPFVQMGTTTVLSVPISPNTESFTPTMEATTGVPNAVGTVNTATAGSIDPTNAPNATRTYSWAYTTTSPDQ